MYETIFKQKRRDNQGIFSILYSQAESLPWALTVPGAEHRFETCTQALDFARSQGWIDDSERRLILIILFHRAQCTKENK